jgi:nitrogenase molybdenum-iron protein alpha chain
LKSAITKNREDYPDTFISGGGGCGDMNRKFKAGCLRNAERSFEQSKQCSQMSSMQVLLKIDDSVCVFHAPVGCTGCAAMINGSSKLKRVQLGKGKPRNIPYVATNVGEDDVVFGSEGKLLDTVVEAWRRNKPKVIFILASCVSGVIGDDIDSVANAASKLLGIKVVPVHCEGFVSQLGVTGIDAAFDAIVKFLLEGLRPPKEDDLVNIFFPQSLSAYDRQELSSMVGLFGKRANTVPDYASVDDILRIPAASATISACYIYADHMAEWLNKEYGIPYEIIGLPMGVENTDLYFRTLGKLFGQEDVAERYIEKEHARIEKPLAALRARLEGKRVLAGSGIARALSAATLANDLGMEVVSVQTPLLDNKISGVFDRLIERNNENLVIDLAATQPYELANILVDLKVDFMFGFNTVAAFLGIPGMVTQGERDYATMGYDGIFNIGNKIANLIRNPTLQLHFKRRGLSPYKETWIGSDPFKYHKEKEAI